MALMAYRRSGLGSCHSFDTYFNQIGQRARNGIPAQLLKFLPVTSLARCSREIPANSQGRNYATHLRTAYAMLTSLFESTFFVIALEKTSSINAGNANNAKIEQICRYSMASTSEDDKPNKAWITFFGNLTKSVTWSF